MKQTIIATEIAKSLTPNWSQELTDMEVEKIERNTTLV
jgi:hypothetical protein